jgi:hypothetical protein
MREINPVLRLVQAISCLETPARRFYGPSEKLEG